MRGNSARVGRSGFDVEGRGVALETACMGGCDTRERRARKTDFEGVSDGVWMCIALYDGRMGEDQMGKMGKSTGLGRKIIIHGVYK